MTKPFPQCEGCEYWSPFVGCSNYNDCSLIVEQVNDAAFDESHDDYEDDYFDYDEGREEMAADGELERRKDKRLENE